MSRLPEVGDVVDEVFRIEEQLGEGNFGAIYRAQDLLEDRTLALKVHKPDPQDADEVRQRFEREARLIHRLEHRNVVQVHYYGETATGLPYMAMEHLEGLDLKSLLDRGYELSTGEINRIAQETLSALEAAHELGIVHRDLKPANIFLVDDGETGHVKVLDFGFAKALDNESGSGLTSTKTLVGSPAYMSPELVHKQGVGPVADLYAMGLIIGEMVAGRKLVEIENIYDTISFQASDEPIEIPPSVQHSVFGSIVARAVEKDPAERYQSAAEMRRELHRLSVAEQPAPAPADSHNSAFHRTPVDPVGPDEETDPTSSGLSGREPVKDLKGEGPEGATGPTDATVVTDNPFHGGGATSSSNGSELGGAERSDPPTLPDAHVEQIEGAESARIQQTEDAVDGESVGRPRATADMTFDEKRPDRRQATTTRRTEPPIRPVEIVVGAALGVAILAVVAVFL